MSGSKWAGPGISEWNRETTFTTETEQGDYLLTRAQISPQPAQVSVPNLVGMNLTAAQMTISMMGLTLGTVTGAGSTVLAQAPAYLSIADPGTPVDLWT